MMFLSVIFLFSPIQSASFTSRNEKDVTGPVDGTKQQGIRTDFFYLPREPGCAKAIRRERMTELIQLWVERDTQNPRTGFFFADTEVMCIDLCKQLFSEVQIDLLSQKDPLNTMFEEDIVNGFCADTMVKNLGARYEITFNRQELAVKDCHAARKVIDYCEAKKCIEYQHQCDQAVRREWCNILMQKNLGNSVGGIPTECAVHLHGHRLFLAADKLTHDGFNIALVNGVREAHRKKVALLKEECKIVGLPANCSYDQAFEERSKMYLHKTARDHDRVQCTSMSKMSPKWMKPLECKCTEERPCQSQVMAREMRIEYHRSRFIDTIMVLQGSLKGKDPERGAKNGCNYGGILWLAARVGNTIPDSCFPLFFDGYSCGAVGSVGIATDYCWEGLAHKMVQLLEIDSGHWFKDHINRIFDTFFDSVEERVEPLSRNFDMSDVDIYKQLQNNYFKVYLATDQDPQYMGKVLKWRTSGWKLEDLRVFIEALLKEHDAALPLIIQDDYSKQTLWALQLMLLRLPGIEKQNELFLSNIHNFEETFDPDGEPVETKPDDVPYGLEEQLMPPQLPRTATAVQYLEGILELAFLPVLEKILTDVTEQIQYSSRPVKSFMDKQHTIDEKRRLGLYMKWHRVLHQQNLWKEFWREETTNQQVQYRIAERAYLMNLCEKYRITTSESYIPHDHHGSLQVLSTADLVGQEEAEECSLTQILVRQYAVDAVESYDSKLYGKNGPGGGAQGKEEGQSQGITIIIVHMLLWILYA